MFCFILDNSSTQYDPAVAMGVGIGVGILVTCIIVGIIGLLIYKKPWKKKEEGQMECDGAKKGK